jgi:hypothetical protein
MPVRPPCAPTGLGRHLEAGMGRFGQGVLKPWRCGRECVVAQLVSGHTLDPGDSSPLGAGVARALCPA